MHESSIPRARVTAAIRFLQRPLRRTALRDLREVYQKADKQADQRPLLEAVESLDRSRENTGEAVITNGRLEAIERSDLKLICFEILSS